MSVGLLVVRLLYRLYVCVHLSKWFTFSVFLSVIFCRVVVFYACTQLPYLRNIPVSTFRIFSRLAFEKGLCKLEDKEVHIPGFQGSPTGGGLEVGTPRVVPVF